MSVKIKDRDNEVEMFRLACTLAGASINYEAADLLHMVFNKLQEKGDKFDLSDAVNIQHKHEQKWFEYYKSKKEIEFESDTDN